MASPKLLLFFCAHFLSLAAAFPQNSFSSSLFSVSSVLKLFPIRTQKDLTQRTQRKEENDEKFKSGLISLAENYM
jgi:hypothetical protein